MKLTLGSFDSCSWLIGVVTCLPNDAAPFMHVASADKCVSLAIYGLMSCAFKKMLLPRVQLTVSGPCGFGTHILQGPLGIFTTQKLCLSQ